MGQPKLAITSPSTINGSTDKSINYQIDTETAYGITGYDSTLSYQLLNLPSGLSLNIVSGAVTGTTTTAGTYNFQVKVSNAQNWSAIKDVSLTISDYSAWNYALPFTTDYSGSPVEDWNMLVRFSEDSSTGPGVAGFRYSQARPNGADLRFVDKYGAELKYEIANWNPAGESQVWVRVPYLKSDANITAYWGNSNAGLPGYANDGSVWDGYFGVYHLEGGSGNAIDSSPLKNDLPGINSPILVPTGVTGSSYSSTTTADNGFLGNISSNVIGNEGTYSMWANTPTNPPDWKDFFGLEYNQDSTHFLRLQSDDASPGHVEFKADGGSKGTFTISDANDDLTGWKMLTLVIKDGYASIYVNGTLDGTTAWYFPGLDKISKVAIGRGTNDSGANITFDEASFSTVGRSADWLLASYNNQKPDQGSNPYLNFGNLAGPVSLDDPSGTKIYGKKDTTIIPYTVGFSGTAGTGTFSAVGLPSGLSLNSATGIISGSTSVIGTQSFTVTATSTTAGGTSIENTKTYTVIISDPASFPYRLDLTLSGYTGSSTLTDFPVVVSLDNTINGFSYNGFLDPDGDGVRTGGDLRFYASNGKELAYEIADWNPVEITPSDFPDLKLWLDAADTSTNNISHNSNSVSQWSDKSGNGNHATQSSSANQPTLSGQKIVFDGSNDILKISNDPFKSLTKPAVIAVAKWNSLSTWNNALATWHGSSNNGWALYQNNNLDQITWVIRAGSHNLSGNSATLQNTFLVSAFRTTGRHLRVNGTAVANHSSDTGTIPYNGTNRSAIGGQYAADNWSSPAKFLNGEIAEILVYDDQNQNNIAKIEGYLAHKWGLTLPSDHPYKSKVPQKSSDIWVKVPSISGTNTVITAAWGKTGTDTTPDYATNDSVWSNGYEGVWHFSASSTNFPDSSPNGLHATSNSVAVTPGKVGKAASFSGVEFADVSFSEILNTNKFTHSIWARRTTGDTSGGNWDTAYSSRGLNYGTRGYTLYSQGGEFEFRTGKGIWGNNTWHTSPRSGAHSAHTWYHVTSTYDGTTKQIWVNGVAGSTNNDSSNYAPNNLYSLRIGAGANESPTGNYFWVGELDEMRISSTNRSADWIKAEYDNQKSSQSLVSYGSVTGPRTITSSLTASGTFGSSFSYTLTATDSSDIDNLYFDGLPLGLNYSDSGQITGTPEVSGTFPVSVVVNYSNDDGDTTDLDSANDKIGDSDPNSDHAMILSLTINSLPPTIDTLPATAISATRANLEGNVTSTGGIPPVVKFYYGTSDGETSPIGWSDVIELGNKPKGAFSTLLGDLSPNTTYYYRARAFESLSSGVWAATTQSFTTGSTNKPVAANGMVTNATGTTATIAGKLNSMGTGVINRAQYSLNNASDAQNEFPGITLWLDAADSNTISTSGSTISTWTNKVDSSVKMYPGFAHLTAAPGNDGNINGKTAIKFDANERLQAKKNSSSGAAWSPLGVNGATNSTYNDFAILFANIISSIRLEWRTF